MDSILQAPEWPASLANFVTWCLMWDPKCRPTSSQALAHEYFADAVDPLRPKSSASRFLASKQSDLSGGTLKDPTESNPSLSSKTSSWFRKSLVARESAPAVPQHVAAARPLSPRPSPMHSNSTGMDATASAKIRPSANKRSTWTNGLPSNAAPIPILPSIRPISPLSDAVTAQASVRATEAENASKKIGRQLSVASNGNHYTDFHRQEAERALSGQRESFFSHLRKRARRLSGRNQAPLSPNSDDIEANAGCAPWASNRQSIIADPSPAVRSPRSDLADLDRAIQNVRYSLDASSQATNAQNALQRKASNPLLKRHHSLPYGQEPHPNENSAVGMPTGGPISSRTRRAIQKQSMPSHRYETPDEEEELLDEALTSAHKAVKRLDDHAQRQAQNQQDATDGHGRPALHHFATDVGPSLSYLTPLSSANCNGVNFGLGNNVPSKPVDIVKPRDARQDLQPKWPTPPYEENDWAASVIQAAWR
ncbi:Serine/threonine protein kinase [Coniosporium tulheliwenetii]|uniref:Serine/threonine protein kinase n=1 Tax=Coniosporium tulheliwenetii TaxID=3383036 RepID=A0ACC2ZKC0_9PEZI|nr:Serine/threonine protein kinase [Cladosporium sp. JES 115]